MKKHDKPLIAVPADCPYFDGYVWHGAPEQYLKAATNVANVNPIIIPSLADINLDTILDIVDGVLITGAKSNVEPKHYGREATKAHEPFDAARDASSLKLIREALERNLPLLAICRGLQELNVALGGTLSHALQELPGRDDHRAIDTNNPDEKFAISQSVFVAENTCLAAIVGSGEIQVNSVHQQGIEQLAPRLVCEANAPDGTIEAVSVKHANSFALGVQWHPEYWAETDTPSHRIFEAFGEAVRQHQNQRLQIEHI